MVVTVTNVASRNKSWDRILYTNTYLIPQNSTNVDKKSIHFVRSVIIVRILLNPRRSVELWTFISSLSPVRSSFNHQYVFYPLRLLLLKKDADQSDRSYENTYTVKQERNIVRTIKVSNVNPYPTAFPYGNGMVLHFYQQQESSTTKTVHKVINKGLKAYV